MSEKTQLDTDMLKRMKEFLECDCHSISELKSSPKMINHYYGSNGYFKVIKNEIGVLPIKKDAIKYNGEHYDAQLELFLPKIPIVELYKIVAFFRDVCEKFRPIEAMVHIYWNKETKEYETITIPQIISSGHVTYFRNEEYELDPKYILVMDIHSHNTMGAFFSGTDNRDEKENRLFGVIGDINKQVPAMLFRYISDSMPVIIDFKEVFEVKDTLVFERVEYPEEWWDNLKLSNMSGYGVKNFNAKTTEVEKVQEKVQENLQTTMLNKSEVKAIKEDKQNKLKTFKEKLKDFLRGLFK